MVSERVLTTGQYSIPVFEGLLPKPFNGQLLQLLYKAAEWHALAKLQLYTKSMLDLLEAVTKEFGCLMQQFRDKTSVKYDTVELLRGANGHNVRSHSLKKKEKKELNLNTYKFHALADYVAAIRLFGTTDLYSTLIVGFIFVVVPFNTYPLLIGRIGSSSSQTSIWFDK